MDNLPVMNVFHLRSTFFLAALGILSNVYPAPAQTINPPKQEISLAGSPFAVATSPDGRYVFASLSGSANGIAVIKQGQTSASLVQLLATGGGTYGLTVTPDGRYLLDTVQPLGSATSPQGVQFIDVQKAIAGQADAVLGTVPTGTGSGPIEVGLSNDNRFAFVSNEDNETVSVIDFRKALASSESASSIVGSIPVEQLPVGLAFSNDGRYLYITNEEANPTDPGYNANACNIPNGLGGTNPGPEGTLTVVDVQKAETNPAHSVLATVYAGCSPVRVVLSRDSSIAWVTARAEDSVLTFSTHDLLDDPFNEPDRTTRRLPALLSTTPVGTAPVGIQLFDHDRLIAVANSNRFTPGGTGTVSILDYAKALRGAGDSATLGTFAAGAFPRQWALSPDGHYLYLTEYSSNILAIFPVPALIKEVNLARREHSK
jgi:DNA-binding beta-propeller fold protein YncE